MFKLIYIADCIRCCSGCGISLEMIFHQSSNWLCRKCNSFLETDIFNLKISELDSDITFLSLCNWTDSNYELISNLILNLKGNHNHIGWKWISKHLTKQLMLKNKLPFKDVVLVPIPLTNNQRNHANILAQMLSYELKLALDTTLLSYTQKPLRQTILRKQERMKIKMQSKLHNHRHIIIVDDVCTTGATIREAKNALKQATNQKVKFEAIGFSKRA